MAMPTTKAEFKEFCLRALGKPVIEINVDEDQLDDRVDYSIRKYWDYHFDGTEKVYVKHQVTANTKSDGYITVPENIIGVVRPFDLGTAIGSSNGLFDIRYQIALNDLYNYTNETMIPYYMNFMNIQFIEQILVGKQPMRYNRHNDRVYIDMDWEKIATGEYIVLECYQVLDPEVYSDAWADHWLIEYATQQIKRQWGANLIKYSGVQLLGGIAFNGEQIYQQADQKIRELEEDLINSYSLPVSDMIG